jgi:hypothetical protein
MSKNKAVVVVVGSYEEEEDGHEDKEHGINDGRE